MKKPFFKAWHLVQPVSIHNHVSSATCRDPFRVLVSAYRADINATVLGLANRGGSLIGYMYA